MRILLCLLFGVVYNVVAFELEDPGTEGVVITETGGLLHARIDENNTVYTIRILKIVGAKAKILFQVPSSDDIKLSNLQIEGDCVAEGECYLTSNTVDYEKLSQPAVIPVDIYEENDFLHKKTFSFEIVNLDDESPTLSGPVCNFDENLDVTVENSNCTYKVADPDGWLAQMDFSKMDGDNGKWFKFQYREIPPDDVKEADVYLTTLQQLDYERQILYSFHVYAHDGAGHATIPERVPVIVEVNDMPDEVPRWEGGFRSAVEIVEKQETWFQVTARDGNAGIDGEINYKLAEPNEFVSIDTKTGNISIAAIDRDAGYNTVIFIVTAYVVEYPELELNGNITLIVKDIDDHEAVISADGAEDKQLVIATDEKSTELNLTMEANDIDFGENALYDVNLLSLGDIDYTEAFAIIPSKGFEKTSLSLAILNSSKLDFETPGWAVISLQIKTVGVVTPTNIDTLDITINLNDINDEWPIFEHDEYEVSVLETVGKGTYIATVLATDKDAEDAILTHELMGTMANRILAINTSGIIVTTVDTAFDYEKQQEVIVQVRAIDKVGHTATAELTINIIDVNNKNPRLAVSSTISVEENQPDGTILNATITASDEDSKPYLTFSIDWSESYAMKNSIRLKPEVFETIHCIEVDTIRDLSDNNTVTAQLRIVETQKDNTPDFEVYDSLYLKLVVTDLLTEVAGAENDSTIIVISIIDINDNPPIFDADTEELKSVIENSKTGTVIASIVATDADVSDILTYSIKSANEDTPEWVAIDKSTGLLTVDLPDGTVLDCDDPPLYNLTYEVSVTDGLHITNATITIFIIDVNDEIPTLDSLSMAIEEIENGNYELNGKIVTVLEPKDKDRDEPFHTVVCYFALSSLSEINNRFQIEDNTITIELQDGFNLDREEKDNYQIILNCRDNPTNLGGRSNPVDPSPIVNITLLDINDNPPIIENTEISGYNENAQKGTKIILKGIDLDLGDNGTVVFVGINKIQRFIEENVEGDAPPIDDTFTLETAEDKHNEGILTITSDNLRDYYGYLVLNINLTDKGTPPLTNNVDVKITVDKFNFAEPKFINPLSNEFFYLAYEQVVNEPLEMFDGISKMENIKASDQQNEKFELRFAVLSVVDKEDNPVSGLFTLIPQGRNQASLRMLTKPEIKQYQVTIHAEINDATIAGNAPMAKDLTFFIDFFDEATEDPVFEKHEDSVLFWENQAGQTYQLPPANYTKPGLPANIKVYYLLAEGDPDLFQVDSTTGLVTLLEELDYEEVTEYTLVIQSSNSILLNPSARPDAKFTLTVNVGDVNDNPPIFDNVTYVATCNVAIPNTNAVLITVRATDVDTTSQGKLRYYITGVKGSTKELNDIEDPFTITTVNDLGEIKQNFKPPHDVRGYFILDLLVRDEADWDNHTDTTQVTIYLVTNDHLVSFTFENDQKTVEEQTEGIKRILDENFSNYSYVTNVEQPQTSVAENDSPRTVVPVFFLSTTDEAPIVKADIYKRVTNVNFYRKLRNDFFTIGLSLLSFDSDATASENMEETLKAWLIGVSVVLGSLCMILLVAFILKTRTLNQRINKLSNTKFGSQESGLNRIGVTAPTTNKHVIEGSNPVYNNVGEKPEIEDRKSVSSGDSELIGVEDDEKFNRESQKQEDFI